MSEIHNVHDAKTPFAACRACRERGLAIDFEHAREAGRLPLLHGDPFDRMLVAQARLEGMTLATADERIQRYDVPVLNVTRG
jgi:PIN domain nuclease of toxin-antitoxin system